MSVGLSLEQLCDAKGFRPKDLAAFSVENGIHNGKPCVLIPYPLADGTPGPVKRRLQLEEPGRFWWPKGKETMPYGLDRLAKLGADIPVVIVEGESDYWTLWHNGFAALGIPGAKAWKPPYAAVLGNRPVYLWQEPGDAGAHFASAVAADLPDVRVICGSPSKDPNALWLSDKTAFTDTLRGLMAAARTAREELEATRVAGIAEALEAGREVLDQPDILNCVREQIVAAGYAGDTKAPLIVYISLTSRLLRRPVNLAVIAPSAAGKNAAVDAPLALVPESSYVVMKAGSPRALIYGEQDFEHKIVIVSEADSIPEEGPAASAVRSLAADNALEYDVVERDDASGKWTVRHIRRPGPTGLITTATLPLKEQLSTRTLAIGIPDTTLQTRAVLHAHADSVNGRRPAPDPAKFIAAQRWLELAGNRSVVIPFAHVLADAVPAELVRMRRDYRLVLAGIETVAFLHQRQRERDAQGRVVATLEDYATIRELLADVFTAAATGGVSRVVREVVAVVNELSPAAPNGLTSATVADNLGLHRNTAWYRLRTALKLGYLINDETRKGHPARLKPGDPLPEDREALPPGKHLANLMLRGSFPALTDRTVESASPEPLWDALEAIQGPTHTAFRSPVEPPPGQSPTATEAPIQGFNSFQGGTPEPLEDAMARTASDSGLARSCHACHGTESWTRPDGTRMCSRCHPNPEELHTAPAGGCTDGLSGPTQRSIRIKAARSTAGPATASSEIPF